MFDVITEEVKSRSSHWFINKVENNSNVTIQLCTNVKQTCAFTVKYSKTQQSFQLHDGLNDYFENEPDLRNIVEKLKELMNEYDEYITEYSRKRNQLANREKIEKEEWENSLKSKKLNMVTLKGIGETNVFLVKDFIFDWITGSKQTPKEKQKTVDTIWNMMSEDEHECYDSKEEFIQDMLSQTNDNDRAVHLRGKRFWSEEEAFKFITKHNVTIIRKYEGFIY